MLALSLDSLVARLQLQKDKEEQVTLKFDPVGARSALSTSHALERPFLLYQLVLPGMC